jgi:hypothetical protein
MSVTNLDFIVSTNEDWRDTMEIKEGDPLAFVDLTGSTFAAHLRAPIESLIPDLIMDTTNGKLFFDPDQADEDLVGRLSFNVPKAEMQYIHPATYEIDILWTNPDGLVKRIVAGKVYAQRGVTRTVNL